VPHDRGVAGKIGLPVQAGGTGADSMGRDAWRRFTCVTKGE